MKVLHIVESLSEAHQIRIVGPRLNAAGIQLEVCCLGNPGASALALRAAGIEVHEIAWSRWFDPAALWKLRQLIRQSRPDLIHAWRRAALRAISLVASDQLARTVVSSTLPSRGRLELWERWLLGHVRGVAVNGASDRLLCADLGIDPRRALWLPRAVDNSSQEAGLPQPAATRTIVCFGPLEPERGCREAIWALDMLSHLYPEARLVIAGTGPERPALEAFARAIYKTREVSFAGAIETPASVLRSAQICWVPSQANCGRQAALEAMAQGCPVIAADVPCLRELIRDGETGLLYRRRDVVGLGRQTRALFENVGLRVRLASAARAWVQTHCAVEDVARQWRELYVRLAA